MYSKSGRSFPVLLIVTALKLGPTSNNPLNSEISPVTVISSPLEGVVKPSQAPEYIAIPADSSCIYLTEEPISSP